MNWYHLRVAGKRNGWWALHCCCLLFLIFRSGYSKRNDEYSKTNACCRANKFVFWFAGRVMDFLHCRVMGKCCMPELCDGCCAVLLLPHAVSICEMLRLLALCGMLFCILCFIVAVLCWVVLMLPNWLLRYFVACSESHARRL